MLRGGVGGRAQGWMLMKRWMSWRHDITPRVPNRLPFCLHNLYCKDQLVEGFASDPP